MVQGKEEHKEGKQSHDRIFSIAYQRIAMVEGYQEEKNASHLPSRGDSEKQKRAADGEQDQGELDRERRGVPPEDRPPRDTKQLLSRFGIQDSFIGKPSFAVEHPDHGIDD